MLLFSSLPCGWCCLPIRCCVFPFGGRGSHCRSVFVLMCTCRYGAAHELQLVSLCSEARRLPIPRVTAAAPHNVHFVPSPTGRRASKGPSRVLYPCRITLLAPGRKVSLASVRRERPETVGHKPPEPGITDPRDLGRKKACALRSDDRAEACRRKLWHGRAPMQSLLLWCHPNCKKELRHAHTPVPSTGVSGAPLSS